jgi:hypothetical protein
MRPRAVPERGGTIRGIEVGIAPHCRQLGIANAVGIGGVFNVRRVSDRRDCAIKPAPDFPLWSPQLTQSGIKFDDVGASYENNSNH